MSKVLAIYGDSSMAAALESYRAPAFLKSPHGAPVLIADFGSGVSLRISFDIQLGDGTSLASSKNNELRSDCYDFICIQAVRFQGKRSASSEVLKQRVLRAIYIFDYLLLNFGSKLARFGISSVTGPNLVQLIRTIAASKQTVDELYDWKNRLSKFLIKCANSVTAKQYRAAVKLEPTIRDLPAFDHISLALSFKQLRLARAYLLNHGLYNRQRRDGLLIPNSSTLVGILYQNTLISSVHRQAKPHLPELVIGEIEPGRRELPGVPTRTALDDPRARHQTVATYKAILSTWRRLNPFGVGVPAEALDFVERYKVSRTIELKELGHTNPVPTPHVLYGLKASMDLIYKHAGHLLSSHCAIVIAAHQAGEKVNIYAISNGIDHLLRPETRALGVVKWSLTERKGRYGTATKPHDFARLLRDTKAGLIELVTALFGAMHYVVGTMAAGRQGEISDLLASSIDDAKRWIDLSTRKSGFGSIRRSHWRPIPAVVAEILSMLSDYKQRLLEGGVAVPKELFAIPTTWGKYSSAPNTVNAALDLFADFVQMPVDDYGRRYYVRQHQLRQFFILAFFYAGGVGGFETLRWFVRHFDPVHLWAYLRQNIPGDVMMRFKAVAVNGMIRDGAEEVAELSIFLRNQLGVDRFDVMTDLELIAYLQDLQDSGVVEIDPLFYTNAGEQRWRLGVSIFGEP